MTSLRQRMIEDMQIRNLSTLIYPSWPPPALATLLRRPPNKSAELELECRWIGRRWPEVGFEEIIR